MAAVAAVGAVGGAVVQKLRKFLQVVKNFLDLQTMSFK